MISLDTNLLLHGYNADSQKHTEALAFIRSISQRDEVLLSEFTLVEFYGLLRNAKVVPKALSARDAVGVIETYRQHPHWKIVGFPQRDSVRLHDQIWNVARKPDFAFRRIYDVRTAVTLVHFGVTEFATVNVKDFQGLGFRKVWNPLTG